MTTTLDAVLEYYSTTYGQWVPTTITATDAETGAVELSVKPGAWLTPEEKSKKLRWGVYMPDTNQNEKGEQPEFKTLTATPSKINQFDATISPAGCPDLQALGRKLSHQNFESSYSCPHCGVDGIVSFEAAVQHCASIIAQQTLPMNQLISAEKDSGDETESTCHSDGGMPHSSEDEKVMQQVYCSPQIEQSHCSPDCGAEQLPSFQGAVDHCAAEPTVAVQVDAPIRASEASESSDHCMNPGVEEVHAEIQYQYYSSTFDKWIDANVVAVDAETGAIELDVKRGCWLSPADCQAKLRKVVISKGVPSTEDAKTLSAAAAAAPSSALETCTTAAAAESPAAAPLPAVEGEPVAFDDQGRPTIVRQVDPQTGAGRTIAINRDGRTCAFGKSTLASAVSSDEAKLLAWLESLTDLELQALVHESGRQLIQGSQTYHHFMNKLQKFQERCHYEYFGLSENCSDKELDNAYKKMAIRMHPDKNGGTEDAKTRFQLMKEKYEGLKERRLAARSAATGAGKEEPEDSSEESSNEEKKEQEQPSRQEAYDEDEPQLGEKEGKKNNTSLSYDPDDRESMRETALKMLGQLKTIETSLPNLMQEIGRLGL